MAKKNAKRLSQNDEQLIPGPVRAEAINEELGIIRCVEKERPDEKILFFEKVKTEQVFTDRMDIWNVHTDKNRYWVITNPEGVYSQALFSSFDYALTFHVGLMYRTASNQRIDEAVKEQDQLAVPWWHWDQALAALERAKEAEEFQAVGILCRKCLLSVVKTIVSDEIIPVGQDRPPMANFIQWSELIANSLAFGSDDEAFHSYLISISKAAWQFVDWLAHTANATRFDGTMAIEATEYTLMAFGAALLRDS